MTNWYVGQKVVCIDGDFGADCIEAIAHPNLIKGAVYTIRGIDPDPYLAFALEEIGVEDALYEATAFKPVVTTDISVFLKMLHPVSEKA